MLGAYDLPAKVPVLEEGMTAFSIRAGIKNNGISSNRIVYPFYTRFETTVDLVPGEVDTLVPYFTLKDGIAIPDEVFAMFDDPGSNYAETSSSLAEMITSTIPEDVYGGTGGSGYIHLDSEESVWEAKSLGEVDLPRGEFVFLEFDYRCNNTLAVGLYANTGPSVTKEPALFLYPTTNSAGQSTWNKVYVDLGGPISNNPSAEDFNVYFESSLGTSLDEAEVWLDNIKIIHYD